MISPCSASKTGKSPVSLASRASRTVSADALCQPRGHGTSTWMYRAPRRDMAYPDLVLEVAQFRHRGGGDVGDLVRDSQQGDVLSLAEHVSRLRADGLGGGGSCPGRSGARALDTGVHVALVVVTDKEHVVVALEHARQAPEPDVHRAAVTGLGHDPDIGAPLGLQGGGHPGRHRGRVGKQGVQPRNTPGRLGVRCREHLETSRGVHRDHVAVGGPHGGIESKPGAQGLTTSLAGTVARVERVRPLGVGLDGTLLQRQQPVAGRESCPFDRTSPVQEARSLLT